MHQMLEEIVRPRRAIKDRALQILNNNDAYTAILRGHTLIEASLYDAVMVKSFNRPAFMKAKLKFMSTVHLAIAFNVISDEWEGFLKSLDSVRGELAHSFEDVDPARITLLLGKRPTWIEDDAALGDIGKLQLAVLVVVYSAQTQEKEHELQRMLSYMRENAKQFARETG